MNNRKNVFGDFNLNRIFLFLMIFFLVVPLAIQAKGNSNTPQLTSLAAANLAYQEARNWDSQAVLWYITPAGRTLDYHWGENDLAWEWSFIFARHQDEQLYYIEIEENQITSLEEGKYTKRLSPILPFLYS